jgi:hypothetical protein
MSRIRTVKPEFWTSEQIVSCSPISRLMFIGLMNFSDDNGVHPASFVRLKAEVFPVDAFTTSQITEWVNELILHKLLHEYVVENKSYWIITGWKKHQRIDKPTYRHPPPLNINIPELSLSTTRLVAETSPTEGKGMEGKGMEIITSENNILFSSSHEVMEIYIHWQNTMQRPRAKLDAKRKSKITQALKLGYTVGELKEAIEGCKKTPFNMGKNEAGQRYDDIELILRDAMHIDRFISNANNPPLEKAEHDSHNTLMSGVI